MTTSNGQLVPQQQGVMQIPVGRQGLVPHTFADMWNLAQCIHRSGMAPKGMAKPEQVLVAMQWGAELGVGPMQALSGIAVINGRPSIWGDLVVAMCRRSGKCGSIKEWTEGEGEKLIAHCEATRKPDGEVARRSFSYQEAKAAGLLGKDTYRSYLRRMLQLRARAFCLRDLFADVLFGLSIAEESQDLAYDESTPEIQSGDDAPLNSLDDAAALLADDDIQEGEYERTWDESGEIKSAAEQKDIPF